jgi:uncharacterized protein (DUF1501 family)
MNSTTPNARRKFLKQAATSSAATLTSAGATLQMLQGIGALTAVPALSALANAAQAAAPGDTQTTEIANDYKAIVCVYFYGGQDHANLLVPYQDNATGGTSEYTRYALGRRPLGTAQTGNGADLAYLRAPLGSDNEARVITSTDTPGLPSGFTTNVYERRFALHPSYSQIAFLYKKTNSNLAIIANTGPMVAPVNRNEWYRIRAQYPVDNGKLPINLYSHEDQLNAWLSGASNQYNPDQGIGGKIASQLVSLNRGARLPISVSVSGITTFLLTNNIDAQPYQVGFGNVGRPAFTTASPGVPSSKFCNTDGGYIAANPSLAYCIAGGPIAVNNGFWNYSPALKNAIKDRYTPAQGSANVYARQWTETMDLSVRTEAAISEALLLAPINEDTVKSFSEYRPSSNPAAAPIDVCNSNANGQNPLAEQLRIVTALIRASAALGATPTQPMKRQVFFVGLGGFDTHGSEFWDVNPLKARLIDQALDAFWQALAKITVQGSTQTGQDKVTLFTMSDFGRTLSSNGQGSDHGWGSHHIVMGGAVKGGKIYGADHNVAEADIPFDRLIPTQKSRLMTPDATAGAMPRCGVPPLELDPAQGSSAPGGKCEGLNHSLDRGELLPTMASDAYIATVAAWFGITPAQLDTVFPTLAAAHPSFDKTKGVGFMNVGG